MPKYAQIQNNQVTWIFEHEAPNLGELYDKYFCRDHIEIISLPDEVEVSEGMTVNLTNGAYVFSLSTEPLAITLDRMKTDKHQTAKALIWAEREAYMLGDTYQQSELKSVYKAMVAAYEDILTLSDNLDNMDGIIIMLTDFIDQLRSVNDDINKEFQPV